MPMEHRWKFVPVRLRKPTFVWIGICLLLGTAAAAGSRVGIILRPTPPPLDRPPPFLVVPPTNLALGEVWETRTLDVELPIQNTSDRDLEIDGFRTSCDCTKVTPERLLIPAHDSGRIRLVLDLIPRNQKEPSGATGSPLVSSIGTREVTITILPTVKDVDPGQIEEWAITARVRPTLRLSASELSFESRSRLARPWDPKTLTVTVLVGGASLTATSTSPDVLVTVQPPDGERGDYKVHVRPSATLSIGRWRAYVRIIPKLAGGEELPAREVPVSGDVLPDVQAIPPTLASGVRQIGAVVQETFTLLSRSGSAFEVRSVRAAGEGVTVTRQADSGAGAVYLVRQTIMKAGDQVTPVNLEVRAADGTIEKLTVEATHFGHSNEQR